MMQDERVIVQCVCAYARARVCVCVCARVPALRDTESVGVIFMLFYSWTIAPAAISDFK